MIKGILSLVVRFLSCFIDSLESIAESSRRRSI